MITDTQLSIIIILCAILAIVGIVIGMVHFGPGKRDSPLLFILLVFGSIAAAVFIGFSMTDLKNEQDKKWKERKEMVIHKNTNNDSTRTGAIQLRRTPPSQIGKTR